MERLTIALVHADIRHGDVAANRRELLNLNREAAGNGADIIVNTELGLTGYSFRSREDIAPLVEEYDGPVVQELSLIASRHGCYIVFGYAEKDAGTDIYYNAAAVIGPDGRLLFSYRKVTAEVRWACAGSPGQPNTFDTPWGRIAVVICSDTYYGSLARMSALRGADLLLVPANWPSGSLDPRELWQVRARENGVYLAACNRGGHDRTMSCEDAWSSVCSPDGEELFAASSCDSRVFSVHIPLENGMIPSKRARRLASRTPARYAPMYLDMRYATDMTSYCDLPEPGPLTVTCLPADPHDLFMQGRLDVLLDEHAGQRPDLLVLPAGETADREWAAGLLSGMASRLGVAVCSAIPGTDGFSMICAERSGRVHVVREGGPESVMIDLDKARIALAGREELYHPEYVTALAKQGCDLVVCSARSCNALDRSVLGSRSIEQVALAVCSPDNAFICKPPVGHYRWEEVHALSASQSCTAELDISLLRNKHFYDRLEFDLLLGKQN
ncbi:carbon-nitrogen hydrolase [Prosthecochloris sp. N3]|uniref:Carbon-nitrogen hydrolase n=1 Tax=Prosthecochloris ethylica TaxID=2743976 RepID=A0ABR9XSL6_9CHLB|nr:nitrilase-related carbon-nitrogen hydrolase [Prosthecochloris ethylica]MBF0585341.1 carbon-nitrogen hydrolase [Prosthecochloris ethylica]MBF0636877.1 carbon-nitrogen hydrolase [Prosthecochloris ethylica]NUK46570.1 carbon-nitrogen hydrolase [Prosthecochloris ethylica]